MGTGVIAVTTTTPGWWCLSTAVLGLCAGLVGTFLLLRKQSLMGDALSHATLPGIAAAFMFMVAMGGTGKWLPGSAGRGDGVGADRGRFGDD